MAMKPYILRSDCTPMENLWGCIAYCCRCIYGKRRIKLTAEEADELLQDYMVSTFIRFKMRVCDGEYDRNYALWQNVFYCAWGCWSKTWQPHSRRIKQYINLFKVDGCDGFDVPNTSGHKLNYRCKNDGHDYKELDLEYPMDRELSYNEYVGECEAIGVEPVSMLDYVLNNGGKAEWLEPGYTERKRKERSRLSHNVGYLMSIGETAKAETLRKYYKEYRKTHYKYKRGPRKKD